MYCLTNFHYYYFNQFIEGAVSFTEQPADGMLYFMKGSNAIMRWDYKVDDGGAKLQYIIWSVQNKTTSRFYTILFEDTDKGSVNVSTQIPQMYVGRVNKTGRATFVIKNLIYEDSAKYTLTLDQTFGQDPGSVVQLTVTGTYSFFTFLFVYFLFLCCM